MLKKVWRKIYKTTHPVVGEIWMLHRIVELRSNEPEQRELEVTPIFLENTIIECLNNGYRFVTIDEAYNIINNGKQQKQPFVCLTFDDGYKDNYTTALPLLERLNVPFAVYVTTGFVDNKLPMWWYPDQQLGLSLDELTSLDNEPLCTIGAHTISHPMLDSLSNDEQKKEIIDSKTILEQWLGHPVKHFSYPHGVYNDTTRQIVKEAGFSTSLRAWGGTIRRGDASLYELPRIILKENA